VPANANTVPTSQTLAALTLSGDAISIDAVSGLNPTTLSITSGGILNKGGSNSLDVPVVSFAAVEGVLHVASGATLTLNSALSGTSGLAKGLAGNLVIAQQSYVAGTSTFNLGTTTLSDGVNTLLFANPLTVNFGATLNLSGNSQYVSDLSSQGAAGSADAKGGIITSSSGTPVLVANSATKSFAGSLTGSLTFAKSNTAGTLSLLGENSYAGKTIVTGGTLSLQDRGTLAGTSGIELNYGTLAINNTGLYGLDDRVKDAAAITMKGGSLFFHGRAGAYSQETVGIVSLDSGTSTISSTTSSNAALFEGATLTLSGLTRSAANGATISFSQNYTGTSAGNLGLLVDGATSGRSQNILVTGGLTLTNNIVGPWAVVGGYFNTSPLELASYNSALGIGGLNLTCLLYTSDAADDIL
jgi:fibronectin-binding autotransporter adhesin